MALKEESNTASCQQLVVNKLDQVGVRMNNILVIMSGEVNNIIRKAMVMLNTRSRRQTCNLLTTDLCPCNIVPPMSIQRHNKTRTNFRLITFPSPPDSM